MTPAELRSRRVLAFIKIAAEELGAAKMLSGQHRPQSAYFLQQTVEKLARAILEMDDVPVGPTHQIQQLARMITNRPELAEEFVKLDELSSAATKFRYPGPMGNISDIPAARLENLHVAVEQLFMKVDIIVENFMRQK